MLLQNLYVPFSFNGTFTDVQVTHAMGTNTLSNQHRCWLLSESESVCVSGALVFITIQCFTVGAGVLRWLDDRCLLSADSLEGYLSGRLQPLRCQSVCLSGFHLRLC
ncbi:hypothetical protein CHARACLAT_025996 [Characodon lateralis]|uniref:Uncharacterized protein n=1 Tax=Characodon lateralis TaxID=208331 RepID=A0ABU7DXS0_9TELE|nr:hypothetical protein [Characodon lateralis]